MVKNYSLGNNSFSSNRDYCFFIDGTVAGTDVSPYDDQNKDHDHTYFGNGCNQAFEDGGGSALSCTTRDTVTYDGETQYIGVYYNFQAATSGFGGSGAYSLHPVSDDTFCPLGWQLPYAGTDGDYYDQSKSWEYLFDVYSIQMGEYPEGGTEEQRSYSRKLRAYPFSYIQGGMYRDGRLGDMTSLKGRYWSITAFNLDFANRMYFDINTGSLSIEGNLKKWQFSVRCFASSPAPRENLRHSEIESKLSFLHFLGSSTARWQEVTFIK